MVQVLSLPLRLDGRGQFATVTQGGLDELAQSVAVLVATPVGSRVEVPDYGTPRQEFTGPDPAALVSACAEWDPRVGLTVEVAALVEGMESVAGVRALVAPRI